MSITLAYEYVQGRPEVLAVKNHCDSILGKLHRSFLYDLDNHVASGVVDCGVSFAPSVIRPSVESLVLLITDWTIYGK